MLLGSMFSNGQLGFAVVHYSRFGTRKSMRIIAHDILNHSHRFLFSQFVTFVSELPDHILNADFLSALTRENSNTDAQHIDRDPRVRLAKTCLALFHRLRNWLQNTLVVHSTQRGSTTPAHFLQHGAAAIFAAQFWSGCTDNFALVVARSSVARSISLSPRRSFTFGVESWEILSVYSSDGLVELWLCERYCSVGSIQRRSALIRFTSGLGFHIEFVCKLMEHFASVSVHGWKCETGKS